MKTTVKIEGLKELEQQLLRLKTGTAKGAVRRALKKAAEPMADLMRSLAPDDPSTANEDLVSSITVTSALSPRQKGMHRKMFKDDRAAVEMFIGPGPLPQARFQEFGNRHHAAQPFARPAFNSDVHAMLNRVSKEMRTEIEKTIARAAARGTLR